MDPRVFGAMWSWYPSVLIGCAGLAAGYLALVRFRPERRRRHPWRRGIYFLAGILALLVALVSPVDALGDTYLFSAHMVQHLLLLLVAPPLLVLGLPRPLSVSSLRDVALLRASRRANGPSPISQNPPIWETESHDRNEVTTPPLLDSYARLCWRSFQERRRAGRREGGEVFPPFPPPLIAWFLGIGTMWVWHLPGLYNAALADERIHLVEHLSFMVTAVIFWWPVLGPAEEQRMKALAAVPYLFLASAATSLLGILLAFAPVGLYPAYLHPADPYGILSLLRVGWGISAAADQQAGGLLMWITGGPVYLGGALYALAQWYAAPEPAAPEGAAIGAAATEGAAAPEGAAMGAAIGDVMGSAQSAEGDKAMGEDAYGK